MPNSMKLLSLSHDTESIQWDPGYKRYDELQDIFRVLNLHSKFEQRVGFDPERGFLHFNRVRRELGIKDAPREDVQDPTPYVFEFSLPGLDRAFALNAKDPEALNVEQATRQISKHLPEGTPITYVAACPALRDFLWHCEREEGKVTPLFAYDKVQDKFMTLHDYAMTHGSLASPERSEMSLFSRTDEEGQTCTVLVVNNNNSTLEERLEYLMETTGHEDWVEMKEDKKGIMAALTESLACRCYVPAIVELCSDGTLREWSDQGGKEEQTLLALPSENSAVVTCSNFIMWVLPQRGLNQHQHIVKSVEKRLREDSVPFTIVEASETFVYDPLFDGDRALDLSILPCLCYDTSEGKYCSYEDLLIKFR